MAPHDLPGVRSAAWAEGAGPLFQCGLWIHGFPMVLEKVWQFHNHLLRMSGWHFFCCPLSLSLLLFVWNFLIIINHYHSSDFKAAMSSHESEQTWRAEWQLVQSLRSLLGFDVFRVFLSYMQRIFLAKHHGQFGIFAAKSFGCAAKRRVVWL